MKAQELIRLGDRIGRTGVRLRLRRRGGDNEGKRCEDGFHYGILRGAPMHGYANIKWRLTSSMGEWENRRCRLYRIVMKE
jgi:hypothetical protein